MKRSVWIYVSDVLAFWVTMPLITTGILIHYVLPPGSGGRHAGSAALEVWGLSRHDWGAIHLVLAFAMIALILTHLVLHGRWIVWSTRHLARLRHPTLTLLAMAAVLLMLGASIAPLVSPAARSISTGHTAQQAVSQTCRNSGSACAVPAGLCHAQRCAPLLILGEQ